MIWEEDRQGEVIHHDLVIPLVKGQSSFSEGELEDMIDLDFDT